MRMSKRDLTATSLVGAAVVIYALWFADFTLPFLGDVRATGAVVLTLGFLASAAAVVPTFGELLHGSSAYLALTSTIGTVAAVAGVHMLVTSSTASLGILMAAMVVLWLLATSHHVELAHRHVMSI